MVRVTELPKKPKPKEIKPDPLNTKIAGIAVDAAKSAQESAASASMLITRMADNATATKADIATLKASIDALTAAIMMPSRIKVDRVRGEIQYLDIHKLRKKH